ncbi:nitroreductase [Pseudoalteromonas citrea]|uniref:Nitroreductase n=1 Tax=Pseudoalteromonas citrea TaxID=43655 RepID=A0A5S3XNP6_9GAMM|nr:nitroreductase [Pseudoalteromonas citrea]TMP40327.1 nitroreductase [Pseudoalteromonas citrea]TMP56924.1 nitroreductase [Pseudoalteromonas citrea]
MTSCKPLADLVAECIELAKLVPSSHNCQPWQIQWYAQSVPFDGRLQIGFDPDNIINALPALQNEMWMSLAGFSAVLINLLEASGITCVVSSPITAGTNNATCEHPYILEAQLTYNPERINHARFNQIKSLLEQRYTYRGALTGNKKLAAHDRILSTVLWHSPNIEWQSIEGGKHLKTAELVARFASQDFKHAKAWRETYAFIDFSKTPNKEAERGFNIQQLMGPMSLIKRRAHQLLLNPLSMRVLAKLGVADSMAQVLSQLTAQSSQIICLCQKSTQSTFDWLCAGQKMIEMWLQATAQGLAIHPLSVLLQHPEAKAALHEQLGEEHHPLFIARVGKSDADPEFIAQFRYRAALPRILKQH